jgi:hypothetical protein
VTSAATTASAPDSDILIEELLTSAGDGMRIHAEELGQNGIAAVAEFHGFQAGEQTTLLLVKQAIEKQNGGFEFIGRYLERGSMHIPGHVNNRSGMM